MTRVLLVDDEKPARERLRRLLKAHADVEIVGEAANGKLALEAIDALAPDVVILDIEMPELDGIGVATSLAGRGPAVIFATAYDEHALRAFELAAVDYLVKPIAKERLAEALTRVAHKTSPTPNLTNLAKALGQGRPSRLPLKSGAQYWIVEPDSIVVINAQDHYSVVQLADGREILCDDTLDALAQKLDETLFLRVHRSSIVNVGRLASLDREGERRYSAVMSDAKATRVPVARERLESVKAALGI